MVNSAQYKWFIITSMCLAVMLLNLDFIVVNLSLAQIAHHIGATLNQIGWVMNASLLTIAVLFIPSGRIADIYGRKKIFLLGMLFLLIGSVLAALAPSLWFLIFARVLQGAGFAFSFTLAVVIATEAFPDSERGLATGIVFTISGLAQATGPSLGGVILQFLGWHFVFWLYVPLSLLAFVLAYIFCQDDKSEPEPIDYVGSMILAAALFSLIFALNRFRHLGLGPGFVILLALSIILLISFYIQERRLKFPLIDFTLFNNNSFLVINIIRFIHMYIWGVIVFTLPLFLQNILNLSPMRTGLILLVMTSLIAIASFLTGKWLDKSGFKIPIIVSEALLFTGVIAFAIFASVKINIFFIIGLIAIGGGSGIMLSGSAGAALVSLPKKAAGVGIGIFYTLVTIGSMLGIVVASVILETISAHLLMQHAFTVNPLQLHYLERAASASYPLAQLTLHFSQSQLQLFLPILKNIFYKSFAIVMWTNCGFSAIAFLLCRWL